MTHRILIPAFLMMALPLLLACSPEDQHSPATVDASDESAVAQPEGETSITVHREQPKVMRGVTPHATGELPSSTGTSAPHHLEAEEMYIGQGGIKADAIDQVLQTRKAFADAVQGLDKGGARSMEAQDMTRHYRAVMERALGKDMVVSSLACGVSVCLGAVKKGFEIDDSWAHTFLDHEAIKVFGFVQAEDRIGDTHERRFLFSMDPELPGVIGHLAP